MIDVPAAVVPNGRPDLLRHLLEAPQQILGRELGQLRIRRDRLVQVVDVRLMVLVVMELHRLRIDIRLQGIVGESQRRQRVRHGGASLIAQKVTADLNVSGTRTSRSSSLGRYGA
jgi:hypothetical protein